VDSIEKLTQEVKDLKGRLDEIEEARESDTFSFPDEDDFASPDEPDIDESGYGDERPPEEPESPASVLKRSSAEEKAENSAASDRDGLMRRLVSRLF
jgi:hypothetical protein